MLQLLLPWAEITQGIQCGNAYSRHEDDESKASGDDVEESSSAASFSPLSFMTIGLAYQFIYDTYNQQSTEVKSTKSILHSTYCTKFIEDVRNTVIYNHKNGAEQQLIDCSMYVDPRTKNLAGLSKFDRDMTSANVQRSYIEFLNVYMARRLKPALATITNVVITGPGGDVVSSSSMLSRGESNVVLVPPSLEAPSKKRKISMAERLGNIMVAGEAAEAQQHPVSAAAPQSLDQKIRARALEEFAVYDRLPRCDPSMHPLEYYRRNCRKLSIFSIFARAHVPLTTGTQVALVVGVVSAMNII